MVQHQSIHNLILKIKREITPKKSETFLQSVCSIANDLDIFKQINLKY